MSSTYSESLQRAVTAAQALRLSLPGTIATREREHAGSGYAYATGALELSLFVLAGAANRVIADDKATDAARPRLSRLLAEASAQCGPTGDPELAENQCRVIATALVHDLHTEDLLILAHDATRGGHLQIERQQVGMSIEDVLALELQQYIAYYLIDQWQDAQDRAQQTA